MNLNLKNPLVFFDLETTGTNITTDRIIELAYVKVFPNGKTEEKDIYINPGMPIPPADCSRSWNTIRYSYSWKTHSPGCREAIP